MGNILICTLVCQLTGCCYGNKVLKQCFFNFAKMHNFAMAMLITGLVYGIAFLLQIRFLNIKLDIF